MITFVLFALSIIFLLYIFFGNIRHNRENWKNGGGRCFKVGNMNLGKEDLSELEIDDMLAEVGYDSLCSKKSCTKKGEKDGENSKKLAFIKIINLELKNSELKERNNQCKE